MNSKQVQSARLAYLFLSNVSFLHHSTSGVYAPAKRRGPFLTSNPQMLTHTHMRTCRIPFAPGDVKFLRRPTVALKSVWSMVFSRLRVAVIKLLNPKPLINLKLSLSTMPAAFEHPEHAGHHQPGGGLKARQTSWGELLSGISCKVQGFSDPFRI